MGGAIPSGCVGWPRSRRIPKSTRFAFYCTPLAGEPRQVTALDPDKMASLWRQKAHPDCVVTLDQRLRVCLLILRPGDDLRMLVERRESRHTPAMANLTCSTLFPRVIWPLVSSFHGIHFRAAPFRQHIFGRD